MASAVYDDQRAWTDEAQVDGGLSGKSFAKTTGLERLKFSRLHGKGGLPAHIPYGGIPKSSKAETALGTALGI